MMGARVRTIELLTNHPTVYAPVLLAGIAIALTSGLLAPFVVLKRLSFIGHGVSHAAFGGAGVVAALGLIGTMGEGGILAYAVIGAGCVGAAALIAMLTARSGDGGRLSDDTFIGLVLVGAMALGAVLMRISSGSGPMLDLESLLFGSIVAIGMEDAIAAWAFSVLIAGVLWWQRRSIVFWTFDEQGASAFGVRTERTRLVLLLLLAVQIVVAMRLAGVLLATALLVAPGAAALRTSDHLATVVNRSASLGVIGVVAGMVVSFETDWPPGACIVLVLLGLFGLTMVIGKPVGVTASRRD